MKNPSACPKDLDKTGSGGRRTITIDWTRIHRRLDAAQAALEGITAPDPDEKQSILRSRARLLASEPVTRDAPAGSIDLLEFLLAREHYAVESRYVREVQPFHEFTPLPCAPAFFLGLINVRGQVMPVVDIKKFLGVPEKGITDLDKVVVIRSNAIDLGILADEILGMRSIPLTAIQPSLPIFTEARAQFVRGITNNSVLVLDVEMILSEGISLPGPDAQSQPISRCQG